MFQIPEKHKKIPNILGLARKLRKQSRRIKKYFIEKKYKPKDYWFIVAFILRYNIVVTFFFRDAFLPLLTKEEFCSDSFHAFKKIYKQKSFDFFCFELSQHTEYYSPIFILQDFWEMVSDIETTLVSIYHSANLQYPKWPFALADWLIHQLGIIYSITPGIGPFVNVSDEKIKFFENVDLFEEQLNQHLIIIIYCWYNRQLFFQASLLGILFYDPIEFLRNLVFIDYILYDYSSKYINFIKNCQTLTLE